MCVFECGSRSSEVVQDSTSLDGVKEMFRGMDDRVRLGPRGVESTNVDLLNQGRRRQNRWRLKKLIRSEDERKKERRDGEREL